MLALTRSPSASARSSSSSATSPRSCVTTAERLEADPERLAAIEERLDSLDRLKRKHGRQRRVGACPRGRCRAEIERLENGGEVAAELEDALAEAERRRAALGGRLSKGRTKAARPLEQRVCKGAGGTGDAGSSPGGCLGAPPRGLRSRRLRDGRAAVWRPSGDRSSAAARCRPQVGSSRA